MTVRHLIEKRDDNTKVSPMELLAAALDEATNDSEITGAIVIFIKKGEPGTRFTANTWRCGVPWEVEVATLAWAHHKILTGDPSA